MILVTGGAGFIGSRLVYALNQRGITNIVVVDDLTNGQKFRNLANCTIADYIDKETFRKRLSHNQMPSAEVMFHQGACSATTEWDGRYMMDNNYTYSQELFAWCQTHKTPFIYASSAAVYGDGNNGFSEQLSCEKPLNVYGYSKWQFDQWLRQQLANGLSAPVHGVRYFNVYGPHEDHKGSMASVAWHLFQQYSQGENLRLFGTYKDYAAGEQQRDFVYVDDAVKLNFWLWEKNPPSGIYNCGTGRAEPFNAIAQAFAQRYPETTLEYIDFPDALKNNYQCHTQADLTQLRAAGFDLPMRTIAEGMTSYFDYLEHHFS